MNQSLIKSISKSKGATAHGTAPSAPHISRKTTSTDPEHLLLLGHNIKDLQNGISSLQQTISTIEKELRTMKADESTLLNQQNTLLHRSIGTLHDVTHSVDHTLNQEHHEYRMEQEKAYEKIQSELLNSIEKQRHDLLTKQRRMQEEVNDLILFQSMIPSIEGDVSKMERTIQLNNQQHINAIEQLKRRFEELEKTLQHDTETYIEKYHDRYKQYVREKLNITSEATQQSVYNELQRYTDIAMNLKKENHTLKEEIRQMRVHEEEQQSKTYMYARKLLHDDRSIDQLKSNQRILETGMKNITQRGIGKQIFNSKQQLDETVDDMEEEIEALKHGISKKVNEMEQVEALTEYIESGGSKRTLCSVLQQYLRNGVKDVLQQIKEQRKVAVHGTDNGTAQQQQSSRQKHYNGRVTPGIKQEKQKLPSLVSKAVKLSSQHISVKDFTDEQYEYVWQNYVLQALTKCVDMSHDGRARSTNENMSMKLLTGPSNHDAHKDNRNSSSDKNIQALMLLPPIYEYSTSTPRQEEEKDGTTFLTRLDD